MTSLDDPTYFATPAELRAWLETNHESAAELWVGFHKVATGRPSITWPELVDELLCFGWIDGLRKSIDEERWMIRVTPRRPRSNWSEVNLRRFAELSAEGRAHPVGIEARLRWDEVAAGRSDRAVEAGELSPEFERRFRARPEAWAFFESQPAGYRRTAARWVMSAKREETRFRRLNGLIEDSAAGVRIRELRR